MAPVKHRLSNDFSLEPKTVKQARVSSPKLSVKRHMSPKGDGGGGGQAWEREGDPSAVSKNFDLQDASPPPPREQERTKEEPQW